MKNQLIFPPSFLSDPISSNSSSSSLCSSDTGLLLCPRAFAPILFPGIFFPKNLHGWFLPTSWTCQFKCRLFRRASLPAKAHQSLCILLTYFPYDAHYFLKLPIQTDTACLLSQNVSSMRVRLCLVFCFCPVGLVYHRISTENCK